MGNIRKRYSGKFKHQVALAALKEQKTLSELSSEYGVHPNQVSAWKKQLIEGSGQIFNEKRQKSEEKHARDTSKLYEEIGRLKIELDWLKKKLGP